MMAGGIRPYHRLWTEDAPSKRIVVTPISGGMICALGLRQIQLKPFIMNDDDKDNDKNQRRQQR